MALRPPPRSWLCTYCLLHAPRSCQMLLVCCVRWAFEGLLPQRFWVNAVCFLTDKKVILLPYRSKNVFCLLTDKKAQ